MINGDLEVTCVIQNYVFHHIIQQEAVETDGAGGRDSRDCRGRWERQQRTSEESGETVGGSRRDCRGVG